MKRQIRRLEEQVEDLTRARDAARSNTDVLRKAVDDVCAQPPWAADILRYVQQLVAFTDQIRRLTYIPPSAGWQGQAPNFERDDE